MFLHNLFLPMLYLIDLTFAASDAPIPTSISATQPPNTITPSPTSLPTTTPLTILQQNSACCSLSSILSLCTSLTPSFTALAPTIQASCLCYPSSTYNPSLFDNFVSSCADYASSACPAAYEPIKNLRDFCDVVGPLASLGAGPGPGYVPSSTGLLAVGNSSRALSFASPLTSDSSSNIILGSMSISIPNSTSSLGSSSGLSPVSGTVGPCNDVSAYLKACSGSTSGFLEMSSQQQASCLCYTSVTSWVPMAFDSAVSACEEVVKTGNVDVLTAVKGLSGFCEVVGDVIASGMGTQRAQRGNSTSLKSMDAEITSDAVSSRLISASASTSTSGSESGDWSSSETIGSSSTTADSSFKITGITPSTTPSGISEVGGAGFKQVPKGEVIGIGFACAMALLFLC